MALFKIFNNIDSGTTALPSTYTKGYMYFDAIKGLFYIDTAGEGGNTGTRMAVNSWGALKAENDNFTTTATPYGQPIASTYIKDLNFDHNNLIFTKGDGTTAVTSFNLTILSYGHSTWDEFMAAYQTDALMYCRASSKSNPAADPQTRLAFMAWTNDEINPTEVQFQYYRSRDSHDYTNQQDSVFVYTLTKSTTSGPGTWTFIERKNGPRVVAGDGLSYTYNNNTLTLKTNITGDLIFKGVIDSQHALPTTHTVGWTYKVGEAGTYAGEVCEVGDTIYCIQNGTTDTNSDWEVLQTNIDGAVIGPVASTAGNVALFTGNTGRAIYDSGFTIGASVPSNAVFTDTTYTFANGSDGTLVITPSSGSATTIQVGSATASALAHSLTFGTNAAYVFDGTADVIVPTYTGTYTLS